MTKSRAKGDGSVYQWKDGWHFRDYDYANGKRRYVSGNSRADVMAKLSKALAAKKPELR